MARRGIKASVPLSPLYMNDYAGFLADSILHVKRQNGELDTHEIVEFQDKIASANRHHKITDNEVAMLLKELNHAAGRGPDPYGKGSDWEKKIRANGRRRKRAKSKRAVTKLPAVQETHYGPALRGSGPAPYGYFSCHDPKCSFKRSFKAKHYHPFKR